MGEGDGTVSLLSLGAMCVEGWKRKRWNPAGIKVTTVEVSPSPLLSPLFQSLYLFRRHHHRFCIIFYTTVLPSSNLFGSLVSFGKFPTYPLGVLSSTLKFAGAVDSFCLYTLYPFSPTCGSTFTLFFFLLPAWRTSARDECRRSSSVATALTESGL